MLLGSDMLEVGIGLVFLYLLLAMICSTLTELIARVLGLRSDTLKDGVGRLLDDPAFQSIAAAMYRNPFIASLEKKARPSYVPARRFSQALLSELAPNARNVTQFRAAIAVAGACPAGLRKQLDTMAVRAGDDYERLVAAIETWFDDDMERVSGWYKRKSQLVILGVGLVLTIAINADTLGFASGLIQNGTAREAFVSAAAATVAASPQPETGLPPLDIPAATQQLGQAGLNLGWGEGIPPAERWPGMVLGWLITAAAVSMGAPFWFDLLTRLVNIRSAGQPPALAGSATAA